MEMYGNGEMLQEECDNSDLTQGSTKHTVMFRKKTL